MSIFRPLTAEGRDASARRPPSFRSGHGQGRLGEASLPWIAASFLTAALFAGAVHAAPYDSPFAPSGAYAFVGVSAAPGSTQVCIRRKADGSSRWIAVGAAAEGIRVVSCDTTRDTAVIQVGDKRMILVLRQGEDIGVAAPQPASAASDPTAPAKPPTPAEQAVQRREDRMAVSDLLEVSTAQRRASMAGPASAEEPSPAK